MIRYIRVLGAALGGLVGLVLADGRRRALPATPPTPVSLLAAWVVAWVVVGFAILPYLTVVPATWLIARVEDAVDGRVRHGRRSGCCWAC